jgi:hypothetical protein
MSEPIATYLQDASSDPLKEAAGWLPEKISRSKLQTASGDQLGAFEALEFLKLGIQGKFAMWKALSAAKSDDPRLQGLDYELLMARAESQASQVEQRRIEAAQAALGIVHAGLVDGKTEDATLASRP